MFLSKMKEIFGNMKCSRVQVDQWMHKGPFGSLLIHKLIHNKNFILTSFLLMGSISLLFLPIQHHTTFLKIRSLLNRHQTLEPVRILVFFLLLCIEGSSFLLKNGVASILQLAGVCVVPQGKRSMIFILDPGPNVEIAYDFLRLHSND